MITEKKYVQNVTNLSVFKRIDGNRVVDEQRVKKIMQSITRCGFIGTVDVNENWEVLDGQGRVEACKRLNIPIDVIVNYGGTIEDCINMNISGTRWTQKDYVDSYAERGFEPYVLTKKFIEDNGWLSFQCCIIALRKSHKSNIDEQIRNGTLSIDKTDYINACKVAEYWKQFEDIKTNRKDQFLAAIRYTMEMEEVDENRLIEKVHQYPRSFENIANTTDAIAIIENVYNRNLRSGHVYIETIYRRILEERCTVAKARLKNVKKSEIR